MHIDKKKAIEALGIDEDLYNELIGDFKVQTEEAMTKLKTALEADKFEDISALAHLIKGSSGNLRIEEMRQSAEVIELTSKKDKNKKVMSDHFAKLNTLFEELKKGS